MSIYNEGLQEEIDRLKDELEEVRSKLRDVLKSIGMSERMIEIVVYGRKEESNE